MNKILITGGAGFIGSQFGFEAKISLNTSLNKVFEFSNSQLK